MHSESPQAVQRIREDLTGLVGTKRADGIVLVPGILNALLVLFAKLRVERIALSAGEYYSPGHFFAQQVERFDPSNPQALDARPVDAVIASLCTYQGVRLPIEALFERLRSQPNRPLLIADYTHAGAVGFPSVDELGADIICGDFAKWLTPPCVGKRLAFLLGLNHAAELHGTFSSFFLATSEASEGAFAARWVDPEEALAVDRCLHPLTREALLLRHQANLQFAKHLRARFALPADNTAVVCAPQHRCMDDPIIAALADAGLVWSLPSEEHRILCRSEVVNVDKVLSLSRS